MREKPSCMPTLKFGAVLMQICVFKSSRWRCTNNGLSNGSRSFVAVGSVRYLICFTEFRHSSGIMEDRIWSILSLAARKHVAVSITFVVGPYDIWSLYFGSAVWATLLTCRRDSSGSACGTLRLRDFTILFILFSVLEKRQVHVNASWTKMEVVSSVRLSL